MTSICIFSATIRITTLPLIFQTAVMNLLFLRCFPDSRHIICTSAMSVIMDFPCNDEMITAVGVQISTFMLVLSRETSVCNHSGLPARSNHLITWVILTVAALLKIHDCIKEIHVLLADWFTTSKHLVPKPSVTGKNKVMRERMSVSITAT